MQSETLENAERRKLQNLRPINHRIRGKLINHQGTTLTKQFKSVSPRRKTALTECIQAIICN